MVKILIDITNNGFSFYKSDLGALVFTKSLNMTFMSNTNIILVNDDLVIKSSVNGIVEYCSFNKNTGKILRSRDIYVFKIRKYSNNTFTIHDTDNKYSAYLKKDDSGYYMGTDTSPSYFQIKDINKDDKNNYVWLLTDNIHQVNKNYGKSKYDKTVYMGGESTDYYIPDKCNNGDLQLNSTSICNDRYKICREQDCAYAPNSSDASNECPKIGNSLADASRYNVEDGQVYIPYNDGVAIDTKVGILCRYNYNDIIYANNQFNKTNFETKFRDNPGISKSSPYPDFTPFNKFYDKLLPDWCSQIVPMDPKSNDKFYKNNNYIRLSNNTECAPWCIENKESCNLIKANYCQGSNLKDPMCIEYCKSNNCDAFLLEYCKENPSDEICNCFLGVNFYNKFFGNLQKKLPMLLDNPISSCLYPPCVSSDIKPYIDRNKQCPNYATCIQDMKFDLNDKSSITDLNILQTQECINIFNNSGNCGANEIKKNGYCQKCNDDEEPSQDMLKCLKKCNSTQFRNDEDGCENCPKGQIATIDKKGCVTPIPTCQNDEILQDNQCLKCEGGKVPSSDKKKCVIPFQNKYSCNFVTNTCDLDISGEYNSSIACKNECSNKFIKFIGIIIFVIILFIIIGIIIYKKSK